MRPSRWDEWVPPDRGRSRAGVAARREGSEIDPGQPEPIDVMISAEERRRPTLVPLFPAVGLSPGSPCPHYLPIPDGSNLYCVVCDDTGMRHHPGLKETAGGALRLKAWKPPEGGDPWVEDEAANRETAVPTKYDGKPTLPTRKQKRAAVTRQMGGDRACQP